MLFRSAMLHFVQPWGEHLSNTGDHGDDFRDRQLILARQDQLWLLRTLSYPTQMLAKQNMWPEVALAKGQQVPCSAFSLLIVDALNKKPASPSGPTQDGHPDSHGQPAMRSRVPRSSCARMPLQSMKSSPAISPHLAVASPTMCESPPGSLRIFAVLVRN